MPDRRTSERDMPAATVQQGAPDHAYCQPNAPDSDERGCTCYGEMCLRRWFNCCECEDGCYFECSYREMQMGAGRGRGAARGGGARHEKEGYDL